MKTNRVVLALSAMLLAGCGTNKNLYTLKGVFEDCDEPMVWLVCGNDVIDSITLGVECNLITFSNTCSLPEQLVGLNLCGQLTVSGRAVVEVIQSGVVPVFLYCVLESLDKRNVVHF